ncbi:MAG: ABC transporter ATP-binding protein [Alphaproteobacteria bacterium]
MTDATPLLSVQSLTKSFGSLVAVDGVSFDILPGEVHCLLGENGAGKSTLSSCLYGLYRPDAGVIRMDGEPIELRSPADALAAGIGMVHQHFVLVPTFTVLENIMVGTSRGWRLGGGEARTQVAKICSRHGIALDLDRLIGDLAVGEQQWVEIVKALYLDVRLLILDEPTAALTPDESARLFRMIRTMAASGLAVVLISHKMKEVLQSDRVTVLRKGGLIGTVRTDETSGPDLTAMMIGRHVGSHAAVAESKPGDVTLSLDAVTLDDRDGRRLLDRISFDLHGGEILGIAGVAGNGQNALFEVIAGIRRAFAGDIRLAGQSICHLSAKNIADRGLGHVPNDRLRDGLVGEFSIAENLILGHQWDAQYRHGPLLDRAGIDVRAEQAIADYAIQAPGPATTVRTLSGGNAQKVILAREFAKARRCLLCHQPTRGLDVGVIEYVHNELRRLRREGVAILLASEELDELFTLADRIAVIFDGKILGIFPRSVADIQTIGQLMAGHRDA